MYQKIIIKPILTEKMAIMQERQNKYAFIVSSNANKIQIKSAVENKFNVSVSKVATMNFNGKLKNMTTRKITNSANIEKRILSCNFNC